MSKTSNIMNKMNIKAEIESIYQELLELKKELAEQETIEKDAVVEKSVKKKKVKHAKKTTQNYWN